MATDPGVLRPHGAPERDDQRRRYDADRRAAEPWRKWYGRAVWVKRLRPAQLARQPLCERCLREDRSEPAVVVNHRTPHEGVWALFVDPRNHESLCKFHHDRDAQREEAAMRRDRRGGP